jgi:uncharacterized repeat protein (TIGR01451 family)
MSSDILKASAQFTFAGGAAVDVIAEHAVSVLDTAPSVPPLLFDISVAQTPAISGGSLYYSLTVSNVSFVPLNNVSVMYRVPAGIDFTTATDVQPNAALCAGNGNCVEGEEAVWFFASIAAGASETININANVAAGLLDGTLLSAPIRVTADELADTMSVIHSVAVDSSAAAQLALSADRDPVMPGETYSLFIDYSNVSAVPLSGAELRVFLPAGVTVVSSDGGVDSGAGEIVWNLSSSSIAVGETVRREVIITAPALAGTMSSDILKASAQISGHNEQRHP